MDPRQLIVLKSRITFFAMMLFVVIGWLLLEPSRSGAFPGKAPGPEFVVTYDASITDSFSGRVYLMLGNEFSPREPRFGPSWINPMPFLARDVIGWRPGEALTFDGKTKLAFPGSLEALAAGTYRAQAVMRRNSDSPSLGTGAGSAYSGVVTFTLDEEVGPGVVIAPPVLQINQVVEEEPFRETERIKLVQLRSELLSAFHGREMLMNAAVILPKDYAANGGRRYPTLYWIGGFGSSHQRAAGLAGMLDHWGIGAQLVVVVLDASCYFGHHAFADSATNGPRGQALITELIPAIEARFRLAADGNGRFLAGGSSGGWSSLYLQVTYPDYFGGTWSLVPDPVDFRDFQRINLYAAGANMYVDEAGNPRPLMRMGRDDREQIIIWYKDFAQMEVVMGEGGQLRSFEAVFSPRGADGLPLPLYDRETGAVDPAVAAAWKPYDIRLILEENWETLGPKLAGKIHVYAGAVDNFFLEGATRLLQKALADLGSDAVVEILAGRNHGNVLNQELMQQMEGEILAWFEEHRGMGGREEVEGGDEG